MNLFATVTTEIGHRPAGMHLNGKPSSSGSLQAIALRQLRSMNSQFKVYHWIIQSINSDPHSQPGTIKCD